MMMVIQPVTVDEVPMKDLKAHHAITGPTGMMTVIIHAVQVMTTMIHVMPDPVDGLVNHDVHTGTVINIPHPEIIIRKAGIIVMTMTVMI